MGALDDVAELIQRGAQAWFADPRRRTEEWPLTWPDVPAAEVERIVCASFDRMVEVLEAVKRNRNRVVFVHHVPEGDAFDPRASERFSNVVRRLMPTLSFDVLSTFETERDPSSSMQVAPRGGRVVLCESRWPCRATLFAADFQLGGIEREETVAGLWKWLFTTLQVRAGEPAECTVPVGVTYRRP